MGSPRGGRGAVRAGPRFIFRTWDAGPVVQARLSAQASQEVVVLAVGGVSGPARVRARCFSPVRRSGGWRGNRSGSIARTRPSPRWVSREPPGDTLRRKENLPVEISRIAWQAADPVSGPHRGRRKACQTLLDSVHEHLRKSTRPADVALVMAGPVEEESAMVQRWRATSYVSRMLTGQVCSPAT